MVNSIVDKEVVAVCKEKAPEATKLVSLAKDYNNSNYLLLKFEMEAKESSSNILAVFASQTTASTSLPTLQLPTQPVRDEPYQLVMAPIVQQVSIDKNEKDAIRVKMQTTSKEKGSLDALRDEGPVMIQTSVRQMERPLPNSNRFFAYLPHEGVLQLVDLVDSSKPKGYVIGKGSVPLSYPVETLIITPERLKAHSDPSVVTYIPSPYKLLIIDLDKQLNFEGLYRVTVNHTDISPKEVTVERVTLSSGHSGFVVTFIGLATDPIADVYCYTEGIAKDTLHKSQPQELKEEGQTVRRIVNIMKRKGTMVSIRFSTNEVNSKPKHQGEKSDPELVVQVCKTQTGLENVPELYVQKLIPKEEQMFVVGRSVLTKGTWWFHTITPKRQWSHS